MVLIDHQDLNIFDLFSEGSEDCPKDDEIKWEKFESLESHDKKKSFCYAHIDQKKTWNEAEKYCVESTIIFIDRDFNLFSMFTFTKMDYQYFSHSRESCAS